MTREEAIKIYDEKKKGGAAFVASSSSSKLTREDAIKKYNERLSEKKRTQGFLDIVGRQSDGGFMENYSSVIPDEYKEYLEREDFGDKSGAVKGVFGDKLTGNEGFAYGRAAYINRDEGLGNKLASMSARQYDNSHKKYDYLTDDEKSLYNYLYNTEGVSSADKYLSAIESSLSERQRGADIRDAEKKAGGNFFDRLGLSIESVGNQLRGSVEGYENITRGIFGEELKDARATRLAQAQRGAVSEDMSGVGQFLYNTAMSGVDTLVSMAVGSVFGPAGSAVSLALMGSQAASGAIVDAKERGYSDTQAVWLGIISGGIEAATEKIGLDALFNTSAVKSGIKGFASYLGRNMLAEGSEEALAEVGNILADGVVGLFGKNADNSNFGMNVKKYLDEGKSQAGAITHALLEAGGDTLLAAAGGALMGLGFGAGGGAISSVAQGVADTRSGRQILDLEHSAGELYGAAAASGDEKITKLLSKAQDANAASARQARLTGKLSREVIKNADDMQRPQYQSLEAARLFGGERGMQDYMRQESDFEKLTNEYRDRKSAAALKQITDKLAAGELNRLSATPEKRYDGELGEIYKYGAEKYAESGENDIKYPLYFEMARSLGLNSNGRSFSEMIKTLSEEDQRGILTVDTDVLAAAFDAGKKYIDDVNAGQAKVDNVKKAAEKQRSEREKDAASASADGEAKAAAPKKHERSNVEISRGVQNMALNRSQYEGVRLVRTLARYLDGYTFKVETAKENMDLAESNAYLEDELNVIHINIEAGNAKGGFGDYAIAEAMTHEIGHAIRKNAPRLYEELKSFIKENFYSEGGWDAAVSARQSQYKEKLGEFSWAKAEEEVVCNSLGRMLKSQRVMNKLAREHRTLFGRIWKSVIDFLDRLISRIRGVTKYSNKTLEQRVIEESARKKQKELENLFVTALREANTAARAIGDVNAHRRAENAKSGENSAVKTTDGSNKAKTAENDTVKTINGEKMQVSRSFVDSKEEIIDLTQDSELENSLNGLSGSAKYKAIQNYILNVLIDQPIVLSDGKLAIVDKRDALHIANKSGARKTAQLSKIKEIVEKAKLYAEDTNVEHNKFNYFCYYKSLIRYKTQTMPIFINVGKGINDGKYHIYDITEKIRDTANRINGLERPKPNEGYALKNDVSVNSIPDSSEKSNSFSENSLEFSYDKSFSLADSTDREALAEAFYNLAATDEERMIVRKYREELHKIDEKLADRTALARRFEELKGVKGMAAERTRVNAQIYAINDFVTRHDEKLLELSGAAPFREMMRRYEEKLRQRKPQNTASTVSMSRGELNKQNAKYTHDKFYSRGDARQAIKNMPNTDKIAAKKLDELIDEVWQGLNGCKDKAERVVFIRGMKDRIRESIIENARDENPDYAEYSKMVRELDAYSGKISFSNEVKKAINNKISGDRNKEFFLRWEYNAEVWGEQYSAFDADEFVTDFANAFSNNESLLKMDTADALLAIDEKFSRALTERKYIKQVDGLSKEEYADINKKIVDELLRAFDEYGLESPYVKELKEARKAKDERYEKSKEKFKNKVHEITERQKLLRELDMWALKIRNLKDGAYLNFKEYRGVALDGLLRDLSKIEYRKMFTESRVREKCAQLLEWCSADNPMFQRADNGMDLYADHLPNIRAKLESLAKQDFVIKRTISATVNKAINNNGELGEKYNQKPLSKVPEYVASLVSRASNGQIDISNKNIAINGSEVWHEYKRHSKESVEQGRGQIAFTPDTIKEAIEAIYKPDVVECVFASRENPTQRQSFVYAKKSHEGHYIVVEAVGGKTNPNIVPVEILQISEQKWKHWIENGYTLGEMLYENDSRLKNALDTKFNKENRVFAAQFASNEAIANTPHSPRSDNIISDNGKNVNSEQNKYGLSNAELGDLCDVLSFFHYTIEHFNKVFYKERWVDATDVAAGAAKLLETSKTSRGGVARPFELLVKKFRQYADYFEDPLQVVRYYDGYIADGGFFAEIFRMIQDAAVQKEILISRLMERYNKFFEDNPKYEKELNAAWVELYGQKVRKDNAINIYMMLKQEDAHAGFAYNGFWTDSFDGKGELPIKIDRIARQSSIEYKRSIIAARLMKGESPLDADQQAKLSKAGITESDLAAANAQLLGNVVKLSENEAYERATKIIPNNTADNYLTDDEISRIVKDAMATIEQSLSEKDIELIALIEESYNGDCRQLKYDRDMQRCGYSNVRDGFYSPILRTDGATTIEDYYEELAKVGNISANRNRVQGTKTGLRARSFLTVYEQHVKAIATYAALDGTIEFFNKIYNTSVSGLKNQSDSLKQKADEVWYQNGKGSFEYFQKLLKDVKGIGREYDYLDNIVSKLRSGAATSALGLNLKVLCSQLSSYGAAGHVLSAKSLAKGFGRIFKKTHGGFEIITEAGREHLEKLGREVDEFCPLAKIRNEEKHVYYAQAVVENKNGRTRLRGGFSRGLKKTQDFLLAPIGRVDRAVVCALFEACKYEVSNIAPLGSRENLVAAGERLKLLILDTQQNSIATERSASARSNNEIARSLNVFRSDAVKNQSRYLDALGEYIYTQKRIANFKGIKNSAEYKKLAAQRKDSGKRLLKSTSVLLVNSIYMTVLTLAFKFLRGKRKDDEVIFRWFAGELEEDDNVGKEIFSQLFNNIVGGLPLIADAVSFFTEGFEISYDSFETLQGFLNSINTLDGQLGKLWDGEAEIGDVFRAIRSLLFTFSQVLGIPFRNAWNGVYGLIKLLPGDAAEAIDEFFGL